MLEAALIMKNTAKFQLNHFFKNTLSSVFNQFKLPSWSVLSELVEPRAVRVAPATSLSIVVAWLSFLVADCGLFC
jgi:hypothetical protein